MRQTALDLQHLIQTGFLLIRDNRTTSRVEVGQGEAERDLTHLSFSQISSYVFFVENIRLWSVLLWLDSSHWLY